MNVWKTYEARLAINAEPRRSNRLRKAQSYINRRLPISLSYQSVSINDIEQNVAILDRDDLNIKTICAMPGESLKHGGLVDWADNKWLITELDAHNEVYEKGEMQQCNHLLKWRDDGGSIVEKWAIVEDGTKYLIGEKAGDIINVGDARIAVTVPKDDDTIKLTRGRRFLIDDSSALKPTAYEITKLNRLYNIFNDVGIFRYILKEVETTNRDNVELRVADYYPSTMNTDTDSFPDVVDDDSSKEVWL